MNKTTAATETNEEEGPTPPYHIGSAWYQEQGKSLLFTLRERLCKESRDKLQLQIALNASPPQGSRRSSSRAAGGTLSEEMLFQEIKGCCSKTPQFQDARLGVVEILFRIFLTVGNRPKTVSDLSEAVREWVGPDDGRVITEEVIQRLFKTDKFYGFVLSPVGGR